MHPALYIEDVRGLVIHSVDSNTELARLIRVCKLFEEPARAKLWSTVSHINHLTRLISVAKVSRDGAQIMVKIDHSHLHGDWIGQRFRIHACYVLDLTLDTTPLDAEVLHPSVLHALATLPNPRALFPRLKMIRYQNGDPWIPTSHQNAFHFIQRILPVSLMGFSIALSTEHDPDLLRSSLNLIQDVAHVGGRLHTLLISHDFRDVSPENPIIDAQKEMLDHMPLLVEVKTGIPLNIEAISRLASLTGLKILDIRAPMLLDPFFEQQFSSSFFPALEQLTIYDKSPSHGLSLLRGITSTFLRCVAFFQIPPAVAENHLQQVSECLASLPSSGSLKSVRYHWFTDSVGGRTRTTPHTFETLAAPLAHLPSLEEFEIPHGLFSIRTAHDACRLMPLLTTVPAFARIWVPVSCYALHAIAVDYSQHKIIPQRFLLIVDDVPVSDWDTHDPPPMLQFETLSVYSNTLYYFPDPISVSRRLSRLFPSAKRLIAPLDRGNSLVSWWKKVAINMDIEYVSQWKQFYL